MALAEAWVAAVLLVSLRVGSALLATPVLSQASVPVMARVPLVLGLSAILVAGLEGSAALSFVATLVDRPSALLQAAAIELALGITMGVAIHLAFSAFALAGKLLDIQIGFGLGQVFDPAFSGAQPILTVAFSMVGWIVFFLLDGHHALLRAFAFSLDRFPLGQPWPIGQAMQPIARQLADLFGLAFALVAPVVFCVLLAELALGVLARQLPQMNMLSIGIPIKIAVGLVALALWIGSTAAVTGRIFKGIAFTWGAF